MATNIGDFFIVSNSVYNVTDEDYQKINLLVNAAKAFARSTHQCVYIIDYSNRISFTYRKIWRIGVVRLLTESRISVIGSIWIMCQRKNSRCY